jgi:hypothetical protein
MLTARRITTMSVPISRGVRDITGVSGDCLFEGWGKREGRERERGARKRVRRGSWEAKPARARLFVGVTLIACLFVGNEDQSDPHTYAFILYALRPQYM